MGVPVGLLFLVMVSIAAAWGGANFDKPFYVWIVGWGLGTAAIFGLRRNANWGRICAGAAAVLTVVAAAIVLWDSDGPQGLVFVIPIIGWVMAAWPRGPQNPSAEK